MNETISHDTIEDSTEQIEEIVLVADEQDEEAEERMRYFEFFRR